MKRATTLLFVTILFSAAPAVAQTETPRDVNPGVIGPDHPLYGIDLALDNIRAGIQPPDLPVVKQLGDVVAKTPGEVAHERASEAFVAAEANLTDARDRALAELNASLAVANGLRDGPALEAAETVLQDLKDRVPDEAETGIQTALDNVVEAKNRFPTDQAPDNTDGSPGQGGV